jgi:uncharacterized protein (DUF1778 family)
MCASQAYTRVMAVRTKEQKAERFVARVTREDKRIFQEAASLEGRSMATFVIVHAREAAEETIARRKVIHLNAEDSRRFVEAVLAPPRPPTPAMIESIRLYRKSVKSDLD